MKKIISLLLICFLLLPLVSCDRPQGGSTETENKVHLVVLAGQSGARGKALVSDLGDEYEEANVDVDIMADGLPMGDLVNIPGINEEVYFEPLEPGYGDFPTEFGPEVGMGQTLASAYPKFDEDYKTVIVKYTASGSTFTDHWYSSSAIADDSIASHLNFDQVALTDKGDETGPLTKNLYDLVEKAIFELTELGYEVVIDGMAFVHGEQDAKFDENMAIYEKALSYFIKDFRDYFGNADMPVVITEALTNSANYSNELRDIQNRVALNTKNVSIVDTGDLYTNPFEPWHFGAEDNIILGNRIAAEILSYNDTRVIKSIDECVIDVPYGVNVDLPDYVKATFDNYYEGYVKLEGNDNYDCNQLGQQKVPYLVKTVAGEVACSLTVNVRNDVAYVDGNVGEYVFAKQNKLSDSLGSVWVIKGESGLYIAADIVDSEIWTDGENWHKGDMGQRGNNDDFIIYLTDSDIASRTTICLSAANLLRVYGKGLSLDSDDIQLEYGNMVTNKKISDYSFHVTAKGLMNCNESDGASFELYISYKDLGIENPDDIKLCFNYNNISMVNGVKVNQDNYLVKGEAVDGAENNIEAYFSISELIK